MDASISITPSPETPQSPPAGSHAGLAAKLHSFDDESLEVAWDDFAGIALADQRLTAAALDEMSDALARKRQHEPQGLRSLVVQQVQTLLSLVSSDPSSVAGQGHETESDLVESDSDGAYPDLALDETQRERSSSDVESDSDEAYADLADDETTKHPVSESDVESDSDGAYPDLADEDGTRPPST